MEFIQLQGLDVDISLRPVSYEEYRLGFQNYISDLVRKGNPTSPVIGVSATEARDYASHMGRRLPSLDEMLALAKQVKNYSSAFACNSKNCLSEWLDCSPEWARENNHSNCIVCPSCTQHGIGVSTRGSIPDRRMSFVTFRLVRGRKIRKSGKS